MKWFHSNFGWTSHLFFFCSPPAKSGSAMLLITHLECNSLSDTHRRRKTQWWRRCLGGWRTQKRKICAGRTAVYLTIRRTGLWTAAPNAPARYCTAAKKQNKTINRQTDWIDGLTFRCLWRIPNCFRWRQESKIVCHQITCPPVACASPSFVDGECCPVCLRK